MNSILDPDVVPLLLRVKPQPLNIATISSNVKSLGRVLNLCKVPHMGWNAVEFTSPSSVAAGLGNEEYCYFVHSYFVSADVPACIATCVYGHPFAAMLGQGRCFAAQFHPEKSQRPGLTLLSNFLKIAGELK